MTNGQFIKMFIESFKVPCTCGEPDHEKLSADTVLVLEKYYELMEAYSNDQLKSDDEVDDLFKAANFTKSQYLSTLVAINHSIGTLKTMGQYLYLHVQEMEVDQLFEELKKAAEEHTEGQKGAMN